jgi:hypothetical protein
MYRTAAGCPQATGAGADLLAVASGCQIYTLLDADVLEVGEIAIRWQITVISVEGLCLMDLARRVQ